MISATTTEASTPTTAPSQGETPKRFHSITTE